MSTSPTVHKVEIRFVFVRGRRPRSCEERMGCEYGWDSRFLSFPCERIGVNFFCVLCQACNLYSSV